MRGTRVVVAAAALVTGACGFSARARTDGGSGGMHDGSDAAEPDALPDAPLGVTCFGTLALDHICYRNDRIPGGTHPVNGQINVDTGMPAMCNGNANLTAAVPGNPCIIAYDSIAFTNATVTITGPVPVIFLATGTDGITVDQNTTLDASSVAPHVGPGVLMTCNGATAATGKGGGYGGSFTETGGKGGIGQGDQQTAQGLPATVLGVPTQLHGGCPGSVGSGSSQTAVPKGGGAIALVASTITIEGLVVAGGDAGLASSANNTGGNGGAAGGMIVIDAPAILGSGELAAKGGGGAQGRGGNTPQGGVPGYNPTNRSIESFGGYTSNSSGGYGGTGGPRSVNIAILNSGGDGGDGVNAGGGGGGGAAGVVIATSTLPITVSTEPAPQ